MGMVLAMLAWCRGMWTLLFCLPKTTSSNRSLFRVTGPLWGESTDDQWIPLTKASDAELWRFLWTTDWANNREAGDLRRQSANYDVIVMFNSVLANERTRYTCDVYSQWLRLTPRKTILSFTSDVCLVGACYWATKTFANWRFLF